MRRVLSGHAVAACALSLGLSVAAATPTTAATVDGGHGWHSPRCSVVAGDGSISYTRDEGATITPTAVPQRPTKYLVGIVTLSTADGMLAVDNAGRLYGSFDAGCSWLLFDQISGVSQPELTAGDHGSAYLWDRHGTEVYRIVGHTVTALSAVAGTTRPSVVAFAADSHRSGHLRAVLSDGTIRDSYNGGRSYRTTGIPVRSGTIPLSLYDASIDPHDIDHIVLGTGSEGAYVSWFGGRAWTHSRGLADNEHANAFTVVTSPVNPLVVWIQGINLPENLAHAPSEGRHIYRSTDGGHTFRPVVDQGDDVTLANGTLLAPSPVDPNLLYFVFGTSFANYGTDLFRYDARHATLTDNHNDHDRITSIAFNPHDHAVMYLGFAAESIA